MQRVDPPSVSTAAAPVAPVTVAPSVTPSAPRMSPSGPVICPVGAGAGSGTSELCNCPANTSIQASYVNKKVTYWCVNNS
jgi:hypothetical protein